MAPRKKSSATRAPSGAVQGGARASMKDGLQNILTGLGTEKEKLFNTFYGLSILDRSQLDAAYRGDWIARKGIDIPAFDTTREWRTWQADPEDVTLIEDIEKEFQVQLKVMKAMTMGRLYGGGAIIIGVDQGQPEDELDVEKINEGDLKFLHAVSRFELGTGPINWDITSPYYGEPEYYTPVQRAAAGGLEPNVKLHPSRVVRFVGNEIPDLNVANGWGDSVLQSVNDAVMSAGATTASISQMVSEAKLDVIKIPGLSQNISSKEYEDNLKARFAFANIAKSVFGIILLDAAEEWERISAQFAGLPDVLKMYLTIASGAWDIPATRFLSQAPQGMNSTGESDTRNYYDRLSKEQHIIVQPKLVKLDNIILRSAMGTVPPDEAKDMWYSWNPLWQLSDKEKAEIAKSKADTFKIDVDAGLINEVVLKKAREAQLVADETYPGLQQILDDFDDDPELEQQQAEAEALQQQMLNAPANPNDPNAQVPNAQKQIGKKAQPPKALPAPSKTKESAAVDGIVRRIADATRPRSLYVRRDVLNKADIERWARAQGFKSVLPDLHVTVIYSKAPVDWLKIGADEFRSEADGGLIVKAGGPRVMEKFGKAVVLCFANNDLQYRHRSMMYRGEDDGISWEYDDYTPHVTITYEGGELDLQNVKPYTGEIRLGPEIFQEIKGSYVPGKEKTVGDAVQLADVLKSMPAPQVHVDVHVPPPPSPPPARRSRTKTVTVTKHDTRGRPVEMVTKEEDND